MTNDVRVHLHGGIAKNWPKHRSQTACTRSLIGWKIFFRLQTWDKLMHLMQSRGGQKIQRARRMHTAKRKDLQQAELEG